MRSPNSLKRISEQDRRIDQATDEAYEWLCLFLMPNPSEEVTARIKELSKNALVKSLWNESGGDINTIWRFFSRTRLREDGNGDLLHRRKLQDEAPVWRSLSDLSRIHRMPTDYAQQSEKLLETVSANGYENTF